MKWFIKPLKSEAIHETGLSGYVVASFFPLIIFIYLNIYFFSNSDVMEPRYKMVMLLVDNLIQGQLFVSSGKKYKQQLSLQFRITSF